MLSAVAWLLAESDSSSLPAAWMEAVKDHPVWVVGSIAVAVFVAIVTFGDSLSGFLSLFGIETPFRRKAPASDDPQVIRHQLLGILKKEVERRLANSLNDLVKLDLYMEDQRQRVGNPKLELVPEDSFQAVNRALQPKGDKPPLDLKFTQKIIEVFERQDIAGKILILGESGSGKTTELLQLAKDLVTRVENDKQQPVPVILELSSWDREPIDTWVAKQLNKLYSISADITEQWLAGNQILLMLDGLDELGLAKQKKCIEKINQFLETTCTSELVVCCRREEYEAGKIKLDSLNGAVYLEALKENQIRQYFKALNRLSLWENVKSNPTLLELAHKPLFLFMLVMAYQGNPIRSQQELFDAYITNQLHDLNNQGTYKPGTKPTPQETRLWLIRLAKKMRQTEFLIEQMQPLEQMQPPGWLETRAEERQMRLIQGLSYGLIWGLIGGLNFGLSFGLIGELSFGLTFGFIYAGLRGAFVGAFGDLSKKIMRLMEKLSFGIYESYGFSIIGGIWSIRTADAFQLSFSHNTRKELFENWSQGVKTFIPLGLPGGLLLGVMFPILENMTSGPIEKLASDEKLVSGPLEWLILVLILTIIYGLTVALTMGLINSCVKRIDIQKTVRPNQGILNSAHNTFIFLSINIPVNALLLWGLPILLSNVPILNSEQTASIVGLCLSSIMMQTLTSSKGADYVSHYVLRFVLARSGKIPYRYANFLNYCTDLKLLQRVGGRFSFMHPTLQKHFKNMPLEGCDRRIKS